MFFNSSSSASAKARKHFRLFFIAIGLCTLFSRTSSSGNLLNKGGFIFERVVTNNLNQEFMSFTRQLDLGHLKPLLGNLKGLINIHNEICVRARKAASGDFTKDGSKLEHHGLIADVEYIMSPDSAIFSPRFGYQKDTSSTCSVLQSRLPEYDDSNAKAIRQACMKNQLLNRNVFQPLY